MCKSLCTMAKIYIFTVLVQIVQVRIYMHDTIPGPHYETTAHILCNDNLT